MSAVTHSPLTLYCETSSHLMALEYIGVKMLSGWQVLSPPVLIGKQMLTTFLDGISKNPSPNTVRITSGEKWVFVLHRFNIEKGV